MIEGLGLETITLQPFRDFEGMPEPQRSRVFARAERKFDVMQELGCDLLMICSNVSPDSLGGIERAAADLHELGERAAKRGMRVAFEALSWGRHIHDYRDFLGGRAAGRLIRRSGWCSTRSISWRAGPIFRDPLHPADKIFLVQMADAPKLDMDYLSWSRHYRYFPGQGELPHRRLHGGLHATGLRRPPVA